MQREDDRETVTPYVMFGPEHWPNYWDMLEFIEAAPADKPKVFRQILREAVERKGITWEQEIAFLRENPRYKRDLTNYPWMEDL